MEDRMRDVEVTLSRLIDFVEKLEDQVRVITKVVAYMKLSEGTSGKSDPIPDEEVIKVMEKEGVPFDVAYQGLMEKRSRHEKPKDTE